MSEEDRWDGVSYVDIPKKTSGFVWMCHRWCSNPHSDTNFIPRWMSFWKSSGELDVKFIRYPSGHLCIDDILRRDKVISQPKMSARIANIIVVRCTIQYSVILVSSCRWWIIILNWLEYSAICPWNDTQESIRLINKNSGKIFFFLSFSFFFFFFFFFFFTTP